jgi:hypothetical protein
VVVHYIEASGAEEISPKPHLFTCVAGHIPIPFIHYLIRHTEPKHFHDFSHSSKEVNASFRASLPFGTLPRIPFSEMIIGRAKGTDAVKAAEAHHPACGQQGGKADDGAFAARSLLNSPANLGISHAELVHPHNDTDVEGLEEHRGSGCS